MTKRTFAVIGCEHGHIAIFLEEMLQAGHRCAGLYEPNNGKLADRFAAQFGVRRVHDRESLLTDDVTIVGCAAVNDEKIGIIELCEARGKNILVDKPAVTSRDGLRRLRQVIDRGAVQIGMLLTERFRPSICTLKRMLDNGELGDLVSLTMRKPHRLVPETRSRSHFNKERNGGLVIDLLIHDLDLIRWLTQEEIAVTGGIVCKNILPEYPDFYDTAMLQVVTEGGIPVQLYADWHTPAKSWTWGDCRIFATGTEAAAELRLEGDPFLPGGGELLLVVTGGEEARRLPLIHPQSTITQDFLSRIEGGSSVLTHDDIYAASQAAIESDSRVKRVDRTS